VSGVFNNLRHAGAFGVSLTIIANRGRTNWWNWWIRSATCYASSLHIDDFRTATLLLFARHYRCIM